MELDRATLRGIIVELRDQGMRFSDIQRELLDKYGVQKSRQTICGTYNRAKASEDNKAERDKFLDNLGIKVSNYCARGISLNKLVKNPAHYGLPLGVTYYEVSTARQRYADKEQEIIRTVTKQLVEGIKAGNDYDHLVSMASYGDVLPDEKMFRRVVSEAHCQVILDNTVEYLKGVYADTKDREIIKYVMEQLNINTTLRQITGE